MTDLLGTLQEGRDGVGVSFNRAYATPVEDLWNAVSDPERLAQWFAPVEGDLREGARFTMRFDDGDVPGCHIIECSPGRQLAFEWPMPQETLVTATVLPDGRGSRLELHHDRMPRTAASRYAAGWDAYLIQRPRLSTFSEADALR